MPIYEYDCANCSHHFETIRGFSDEPLINCPVCGEATLQKLISVSAFHLKGTGWYKPSVESKVQGSQDKQQDAKSIASTTKPEDNSDKK